MFSTTIALKVPPIIARSRQLIPERLSGHFHSKKSQKYMLTGDYHARNNAHILDRCPVPHSWFLYKPGSKRSFPSLDLARAYYHISVTPEDNPKTAITMPVGLNEVLCLLAWKMQLQQFRGLWTKCLLVHCWWFRSHFRWTRTSPASSTRFQRFQ